ncbi:non-ribosomal peptide synthetase [Chitiniphilus eburneus]|nr:non-ribosomal peptide synthetase [Chitiniphilus eburneus]
MSAIEMTPPDFHPNRSTQPELSVSIAEFLAHALQAGSTLPDVLAARAALGRQAMYFLDRDGVSRALPYADLYRHATQLAAVLARQGVRPGDPVVVCCDDEYRLVQCLWGVFLAGAVAVPLGAPRSYAASDEAWAKVGAVVQQCAALGDTTPLLLSDLDRTAVRGATADHVAHARWLDADTLLAAGVAEPAPAILPRIDADALALLMYSSGSTGDAKGVRLTHRQLLWNVTQIAERSMLVAADRSLSWLPLTHDMGLVLFHLCHALAGIDQYKTTPLSFARDPAAFLARIEAHGATLTGMPNFGFDQLLRAGRAGRGPAPRLETLRLIYNGAEPIDPALCRDFTAHFATCGLAEGVISPGWGIAEACVVASQFPQPQLAARKTLPTLWLRADSLLAPGGAVTLCAADTPGAREIVALGPLMRGMRAQVLDDDGVALPPGHLGHLQLAGPNVSAGYFGQPDRDWVTTGDLGFVHDDCLYLTGRAKDVVFVNGRNHFANDLETALTRELGWPANQIAVVGATDPATRRERVVVFFRQSARAQADAEAAPLRAALERLLAYPVAGAVGLAALPKTPSGKIRRFALRQALEHGEFDAVLAEDVATACRALSAAECALLDDVRALLPALPAEIDPELSLARHGLDSVGFMQLAFRLGERLGRALPLAELLRAGSLAGIARWLEADVGAPAFAVPIEAPRVPLTARQRMLWTAWLLQPDAATYHESYWLRLNGGIDASAWLAAARRVVAGYAMLNAVVDDRAEPALAHAPLAADIACLTLDAAAAQAALDELGRRPFDLRRGPLLRLRLIECGDQHLLGVTAHHLIVDGWSLHQLISQILAVATGADAPVPENGLWLLEDAAVIGDWPARLAAAEPVQLPSDRPRAAPGAVGDCLSVPPAATSQAVRDYAQRHGGSEFAVLAASLAVVLGRLAQVETPLLGTVASGRHHPASAQRIGYFATTLPLIVPLRTGQDFAALVAELDRQRPALLGGQVPDLATLAAGAGVSADAVRVVYVHQNMPALALPAGIDCVAHGQQRADARVDLTVSSQWRDGELALNWEYDSARFSAAQIAGYAELHRYALLQLLGAPQRPLADLDLLSPAQRALWRPYQDTRQPVDHARNAVARFEATAAAMPGRTALSDEHAEYRYGALREKVDALCWLLQARGVHAGDRIGLFTARSADYPIALLAVLKLGLVAVPLDPALPAARLGAIVEDSAPALLLVTPGMTPAVTVPTLAFTAATLRSDRPHPGHPTTPDDAAYLIFTSGSTGRPKGVLGTQRCLTNLIDWVARAFDYRAGETMCQFAPFSFDVSLAEILPSLCAGLHLHVLSDERRASPLRYLDTLRERDVRIATVTPAYLAVLNEVPDACRDGMGSLRLLILGGEALRSDEVRRLREHSPQVNVMNVYGPTETTVLSTALPVPAQLDARPWQPLGLPIANTEVWVLDDAGRVCPASVPGTLHIGGDGLSAGYWCDSARTAAAFVLRDPDGAGPRPFYDTGDVARLAPDGQLDFVGRADNQIKLRGFRIELGEIETALERLPGIERAVVKAHARDGQERVLVAWYTGVPQPRAELDRALCACLPAYMVPSLYQHLAELPLSANRKVDRNRLPEPDWAEAGVAGDGAPPRGDTETALAAIWAELLGVRPADRDAHFFLLGGSSLAAARLVNRVRDHFGRRLALPAVLQHPTLAALAAQIDAAPAADDLGPRAGLAVDARCGPATDAQARMYFLDRAHPGSALNNMPLTLALDAAPDAARLATAWDALVARHPLLRARFALDGDGLSLRLDAPAPTLERLVADDAAAEQALHDFHRRAFALDTGPLWRCAVAGANGRYWLALSVHHAVADGVTLIRMLGELDALYRGETLPRADAVSYLDYAAWQRERLAGDYGVQAAAFWREPARFAPPLPLPAHAAEAGPGRQTMVALDAVRSARLDALCARHGVSPFVLGLGLFSLALGQRCGSERFAVGITFAGRAHAAVEQMPGLFVNTLPLAFDWSPAERLPALLQRLRERLMRMQAFEDYPLNRAMAAQGTQTLPFNVLFNEEVLPARLRFGDAPATLAPIGTGTAKFPLVISFLFDGAGWRWRMESPVAGLPQSWLDGLLADVTQRVDALDGLGDDATLGDLAMADGDLLALLATN